MATRSKVPKEEKQRRRSAREREDEKLQELLVEMTERLIVSSSAADVMGGLTAEIRHGLQHDRPIVEAAAGLWKRARPDHALTAVLAELAGALARHDELLKGLVDRFEQLIEAEDVVADPTEADLAAIRAAVIADHHHDH